MKKITLIFFCLLLFKIQAQTSLNSFKGLKSSGNIPEIFIKSLEQEIYDQENYNIDSKDKRNVKRSKKDFVLQSSYVLKQELYDGKCII